MAIIIDESNPNHIERNLLVDSTKCLGNRLVALWLDYGLLFGLGFIAAIFIDTKYVFLFWIYIALACLYFPVLEGIKGWTFGKYICCIRVIDEEGYPPGFLKAFIRTLLRVFEVNPFIFGALPAMVSLLFSKTHQRIGDRLANTHVVKSKSVKYQ